jgi:hypothetical protein
MPPPPPRERGQNKGLEGRRTFFEGLLFRLLVRQLGVDAHALVVQQRIEHIAVPVHFALVSVGPRSFTE